MIRTLPVIAALLLVPGAAAAQYEAPPPSQAEDSSDAGEIKGVALSLGTGYGTALGDSMKSSSGSAIPMSSGISGQLPFQLGLSFRTSSLFSFGLVFQYAALMTKNCDTASSCSANDTRIGGEARLHFATEELVSPWLSAGIGFEWLSLSESGASTADTTLTGIDFDFQVGGDFRVSRTFTVGPFFGLRVGSYDSGSATVPGYGSRSADIPSASQTVHSWMTFGIRGVFMP